MDDNTPVGQRIAYWRNRRGLTQQVLSGLVGRSVPWLSRIERGDRTVERIADLLALANVLKIKPSELLGGFELPPNGGDPLEPPRGIHAIGRALLAVSPPDREAPPAAELRTAVEHAYQLKHEDQIEALGVILPELIVSGGAAVAQEIPGAWWSLAAAYRIASRLARNLGERTLAWIAATQAVAAAQRSGDELLVAASARHLAFALLSMGMLDEAGAVCSNAADALAPTDASSPAGWSMWGSLQLTQAVTVTRGGKAASGWRLLRDARAAAERVGPGRDDYWESFGPANVGAHEVAVELESGDAVEALRIADHVEVDDLPASGRRAVYLVDVAHAHTLRRDDGAAVAVLLEAERHGPESVRYSVLAHELARVCLGRERKSRTPGLRGLAERLGITD